MFYATSPWGFPYKAGCIISRFNEGKISLTDALSELGKEYTSKVGRVNTSKGERTEITFGVPIIARFVF